MNRHELRKNFLGRVNVDTNNPKRRSKFEQSYLKHKYGGLRKVTQVNEVGSRDDR